MRCLLLSLFLMGCAKDPITTNKTDNEDVEVSLLFTHDSCKVYRFYDGGRFHYFTNCNSTITSHSESCGKSCIRQYSEEVRGIK